MQADSAPALQDEVDDQSFNDQQVAYRSNLPFITPAMHAFAAHWALNRNQIKAYQHAYPGSSANAAKTEARRLMADPRVQSEIRRVVESWSEKSGITIAQLEQELTRLARSDIRRVFDPGFVLRDPHTWDADTAAAVASYKETQGKYGVTRSVRFHDKNSAARTLLEAKGAFEKHKAPPGAAAIFNINLGGQPMQLGAAPVARGRTLDMDVGKPARAKKSPARQGQRIGKAEKRPNAVLARPSAMSKLRQKALQEAETVENPPLSADPAQTDDNPTPPAKPDLF